MSEVEKMLEEIRKNREQNVKNLPPGRESERFSYFELDGEVIAVSHQYGEVIFDDEIAEEGEIEYLFGENMTLEIFNSALSDEGFDSFLKQWCEEEHCTRALISRVDPLTRSPAKVERIRS